MKMKLEVTSPERTAIVAALLDYGMHSLANKILGGAIDPADDGPEVAILSVERSYLANS